MKIVNGVENQKGPKESKEPPFIVAEVSRNWPESGLPTIAQMFETVINHNYERGYRLSSWRLQSTMTGPDSFTETIIAVFALQFQNNRNVTLTSEKGSAS